jgi:hypothetical protein
MAQQTRNTLKGWFMTNLFPVQQQFWDWIDSFRHNSDTIALADVDGLVDILNSKQDIEAPNVILVAAGVNHYDVPAGTMLEKIWFQLQTAASIGVGTALGINDIYDPADGALNGDLFITGDKPFRAATRIYFNGIQNDTVTIIYKR